ncbi:MAG: ABC transporter substrate-binding protein [Promethearchaeota archaeon]
MKTEKAIPKKKKIPKIKEYKKSITIGGIIGTLAIAGLVIGIVIFPEASKRGRLIAGVSLDIHNIDTLLAHEDRYICNQIAETLFENDYSGATSRIIHNLAIGSDWSLNATELTCYLRDDVKFHDGTSFNATAVKWNFDRIYNLIDLTVIFDYLFLFPDGRWIVNETRVLDEYTVKFVLNAPYVPFQQLLTHHSTGILSPTSTPFNRTISKHTEKLIGTGPFIYGSYIPNVNLTLYPNQNYWGQKPKIDEFVVLIYSSGEDLWNDFLGKEIDMLFPMFFTRNPNISINTLITDPDFIIPETFSTNYRYIAMNNKLINLTMRKAISYAINYSYMVEEILPPAVRARSPIPEGILYSNTTAFEVPNYNITKARQILIDELGPFNSRVASLTANENITAGNEWERLVTEGVEIAKYTLDYKPGHRVLEGLATPVPDNLKQIGIKVILSTNWSFPYQLFTSGWPYSYNDPHDAMINYYSTTNWVQLNDSYIDKWIEEGVKETNPNLRKQIYYKIQERVIEELYAYIWAFSARGSFVYVSDLRGWQSNPFKLSLKTVYFV